MLVQAPSKNRLAAARKEKGSGWGNGRFLKPLGVQLGPTNLKLRMAHEIPMFPTRYPQPFRRRSKWHSGTKLRSNRRWCPPRFRWDTLRQPWEIPEEKCFHGKIIHGWDTPLWMEVLMQHRRKIMEKLETYGRHHYKWRFVSMGKLSIIGRFSSKQRLTTGG